MSNASPARPRRAPLRSDYQLTPAYVGGVRREGDLPGEAPVRLVTRPRAPVPPRGPARFRLVAVLLDGRRQLVCLGHSPREVRATARERVRLGEVPRRTVGWVVQKWEGTAESGRWADLPTWRD